MYTTMRPCFGCTKELLQAKITGVRYLHEWVYPDPETRAQYDRLQARFADGVKRVQIEDPDAEWAITNLRKKSE